MHIFEEERRPELLGRFIVARRTTVRDTALHFGISKSTVHKDVTAELRHLNYPLYLQVNEVLQKNKNERHLRGGAATRKKYAERKRRGTR